MLDLTTPIVPYKGTGIFELDASHDEVKSLLKAHNISYVEEVWKVNDTDPPWIIINNIGDDIELFFAKDKLFKIVLLNNFRGALPNGICIGSSIDEAQKLDPHLNFDDWDEKFISSEGYVLEHDIETRKILVISIFIPALLRDDFYDYNW